LEPSDQKNNEITSVVLEKDGDSVIFANLYQPTKLSDTLDLHFNAGETISLRTRGNGIVHLTGYVVQDTTSSSSNDSGLDDSISSEEKIVGASPKYKSKDTNKKSSRHLEKEGKGSLDAVSLTEKKQKNETSGYKSDTTIPEEKTKDLIGTENSLDIRVEHFDSENEKLLPDIKKASADKETDNVNITHSIQDAPTETSKNTADSKEEPCLTSSQHDTVDRSTMKESNDGIISPKTKNRRKKKRGSTEKKDTEMVDTEIDSVVKILEGSDGSRKLSTKELSIENDKILSCPENEKNDDRAVSLTPKDAATVSPKPNTQKLKSNNLEGASDKSSCDDYIVTSVESK
jgi:hypothetical protein